MIRLCPNCNTERPVTEMFCEASINGQNCGWDLSSVDISQPGSGVPKPAPAPPTLGNPICPNGHANSPGDLICSICGEAIDEAGQSQGETEPGSEPAPEPEPVETVIDGWHVHDQVPSSSAVRERFIVVRESDAQRGVLTLYASGSEPDPAIYGLLRGMPNSHVLTIIATGRWGDRAYEVAEELPLGSLSDVPAGTADTSAIKALARELGQALHHLADAGIRHRDLRPATVFTRSRDPLDLVIGGFGSARLSELDLDIASPLETTRYMAPEAIAGGVAAASDWWSLGMILLERITNGACFDGVNEQAFLIHVLTNGVPIPENLDPPLGLLLRGLLARDRRQRWQWKELQAWIAGEAVTAPDANPREQVIDARVPIRLGGKDFRSAESFALAAAEAANWDEAKALLLRGAVATWTSEAGLEARIGAALRQLIKTEGLTDDLKLSIAMKTLNPAMPMIVRGNIVTPGWLLDHPDDGHKLITGPAPDLIRRIDPDDWLWRLKVRAETVRKRVEQLEIAVDEESLRVHLLSTSMARLAALWEEKRKLFPDTDHAGVASLIERRQSAEEDLVILLSASSTQFRSIAEVVDDAAQEAKAAGLSGFSNDGAIAQLARPRREIYQTIDSRIENFARCGVSTVDEWADQFRLDRRMSIGRALALLCVPGEAWKPLPKQGYVSTILDFFAKRISGGVLRGPLTRMLVGSTKIDLTELDTPRRPATEILDHLLARGSRTIDIDPAAFSNNDSLDRRLRSLHSHALLYKRDTGIDGLYLGFPFLLMRENKANVKPRIAPVLLWPARVLPEVGNRGHITLGYGRERSADTDAEHVIVNPALEGMVGIAEARRWQEAAREVLTRATLSIQDVIDTFSQLAIPAGVELVSLPGKDVKVPVHERQVVPAAVLFHLAFMGQAVMKDLELLRGLPPTGTALEAALRLTDQTKESPPPAPAREIERFFTADSDPSQEAAVIEARQGPGLVIEGPPGTGKSQTIVNMVADAIGMGKSLLVVCQKQAALDVVRKRLEREELGSRFVMITDSIRDRVAIVGSIRTQVDTINNRPAGGTPSWKRERERFAARIEALETEIDRQQAALHAVDERTGLTYRTLLSELLEIESGEIKPIDAPLLRPLLSKLHPTEITTLEENCGPLARFWLAAKFEGSPFSVLNTFSADRGTAEGFADALSTFAEVDARREVTDAETSDSLKTSDAQALRAWLVDAEKLRSISDAVCANLGRWLPLFRATEGDGTRGTNMLAGLVLAQKALASLDASRHTPGISEKLVSIPDNELRSIAALVSEATRPATGFASINPMRWIRKRRLRNLILSIGLDHSDKTVSGFANALGLEIELRPLRLQLSGYLLTLFDRAPEADSSPRKLATFASNLHSIVNDVHAHLAVIDSCPNSVELDWAVLTSKTEVLDEFFERAERALKKHDARELSHNALTQLNSYFNEAWLKARRNAISNGHSNSSAITLIRDALPSLADYQEFRLRSTRLGEREHSIFQILRSKESELTLVPTSDLDACVRGTIGREALLAWKAPIEASNPDVRFDGDALRTKVKSLAEADTQIRNRNRELLIRGIEGSRVHPTRDWDPITRLTGPRALRLREFIERAAPLGLFALRPIWLMTPDVASRVLQPRAGLFDTVIFDEASQMPVEYALPSLFRSKIMVVSGDEKQMPPTNFFASKVENDEAAIFDGEELEEAATDEERDTFTETWNRREIKDCPDLLQLARSSLRTKTLQVHYRSKYRELISFSNASFYGNRLSVPVRHPDDIIRRMKPIEVIRSDGLYSGQTNLKEATDVIEYLSKLWEDSSPPSVGVVTFNRKQADAIEDALEDRAEEDSAFRDALMRERERLEDGEDIGFFVKNVENVQGDERDVIIFSTTFGPNESGTFRKNFGVLGHGGGERRLNVAVTRAREKVVIITSMPVNEISGLLSGRGRPRVPRDYLQGYLEFARTVSDGATEAGRSLLERMVTDKGVDQDRVDPGDDDGFTQSVEKFLQQNGWHPAQARDGGAFGLDFAIRDPRTGLYAIGVECDAPRHRLLERARAREVWRPKVLAKAVPYVHRVSSYAWIHSGETERERLKAAVENALRDGGGMQ